MFPSLTFQGFDISHAERGHHHHHHHHQHQHQQHQQPPPGPPRQQYGVLTEPSIERIPELDEVKKRLYIQVGLGWVYLGGGLCIHV